MSPSIPEMERKKKADSSLKSNLLDLKKKTPEIFRYEEYQLLFLATHNSRETHDMSNTHPTSSTKVTQKVASMDCKSDQSPLNATYVHLGQSQNRINTRINTFNHNYFVLSFKSVQSSRWRKLVLAFGSICQINIKRLHTLL